MVTEISDRDHAWAVCANLAYERDQLDPSGPAWQLKDLEFEAALAALFSLGPDPRHHDEDPSTGSPPVQRGPAD